MRPGLATVARMTTRLTPQVPAPQLTRWLVRLVLQVPDQAAQRLELRVWAYTSTDATRRARAEILGTWSADVDQARQLRAAEVLQEGI